MSACSQCLQRQIRKPSPLKKNRRASPQFWQYIASGLIVHTENFIQRFQPDVTMLRPYRLVSTFSVSSSRKSLISKAFAPDNIFGRDRCTKTRMGYYDNTSLEEPTCRDTPR